MSKLYELGQRVTKAKGSNWTGLVVGFYSTELTPVGYAVESETEKGSVQIYPEAALVTAPPTVTDLNVLDDMCVVIGRTPKRAYTVYGKDAPALWDYVEAVHTAIQEVVEASQDYEGQGDTHGGVDLAGALMNLERFSKKP